MGDRPQGAIFHLNWEWKMINGLKLRLWYAYVVFYVTCPTILLYVNFNRFRYLIKSDNINAFEFNGSITNQIQIIIE